MGKIHIAVQRADKGGGMSGDPSTQARTRRSRSGSRSFSAQRSTGRFEPGAALFLNSTGAHGAHIPADVGPETLQRYIYQFRIGPTPQALSMLRSVLPEKRRPLWTGKAQVGY